MQKTDIIKINSILFNIEKWHKMYGIEKVEDIYHIYDDYAKSLESDHKNRIKIGLFLAKLNKNKENLSGSNLTSLAEKLEALEELI